MAPRRYPGTTDVAFPDFRLLEKAFVGAAAVTGVDGAGGLKPGRTSLSLHDWAAACVYSHSGAHMVFEQSLDAVLLKEALAQALAATPWLAGRVVCHPVTGRPDVVCNNAGALFAVGSAHLTLEQLVQATAPDPHTGLQRSLANPFARLYPRRGLAALVRRQAPLASGCLLHLRGGGSVLWVTAHHAVADFTTLQCFAAHWSAAYNHALEAMRRRQPELQQRLQREGIAGAAHGGKGFVELAMVVLHDGRSDCSLPADQYEASSCGSVSPSSSSSSSRCSSRNSSIGGAPDECPRQTWPPPYAHLLPAGFGQQPSMDPSATEALADADAAARLGLKAAAEYVKVTLLTLLRLLYYVVYHLLFRGGGGATSVLRVPASRLAQLKQQASQQLAQIKAGKQPQGEGVAAAATPKAAMCASELDGADWVSTLDSLNARIAQVLHSVPARCRTPLNVVVPVNMRLRVQPPLPPTLLGNYFAPTHITPLQQCGQALGFVAGKWRAALSREALPRFQAYLAELPYLLYSSASRSCNQHIMNTIAVHRDPTVNFFSPQGTVLFNNWQVNFDCWKFGGRAPLRMLPNRWMDEVVEMPNFVLVVPAADGDGVFVCASQHNLIWSQLQQQGGLRI